MEKRLALCEISSRPAVRVCALLGVFHGRAQNSPPDHAPLLLHQIVRRRGCLSSLGFLELLSRAAMWACVPLIPWTWLPGVGGPDVLKRTHLQLRYVKKRLGGLIRLQQGLPCGGCRVTVVA